ncbi:SPX domain-containing protein [Blastocladiella britannica]|nr:SPX domain-containing protein [Blastocladiella britannica]
MKFNKTLQREAVPEWRAKYIDYRGLKKLLTKVADDPEVQALRAGGFASLGGAMSPATLSGASTPGYRPWPPIATPNTNNGGGMVVTDGMQASPMLLSAADAMHAGDESAAPTTISQHRALEPIREVTAAAAACATSYTGSDDGGGKHHHSTLPQSSFVRSAPLLPPLPSASKKTTGQRRRGSGDSNDDKEGDSDDSDDSLAMESPPPLPTAKLHSSRNGYTAVAISGDDGLAAAGSDDALIPPPLPHTDETTAGARAAADAFIVTPNAPSAPHASSVMTPAALFHARLHSTGTHRGKPDGIAIPPVQLQTLSSAEDLDESVMEVRLRFLNSDPMASGGAATPGLPPSGSISAPPSIAPARTHGGHQTPGTPNSTFTRNPSFLSYRGMRRRLNSQSAGVTGMPLDPHLPFREFLNGRPMTEQLFFHQLDAEGEKVLCFYNEQLKTLQAVMQQIRSLIINLESKKQQMTLNADGHPAGTTAGGIPELPFISQLFRPGHSHTADAKLKVLRSAMLENYRALTLLRNYQVLNFTGFFKILKKFDKTAGWRSSQSYFSDRKEWLKWDSDPTVRNLLRECEVLYVNKFAKGRRSKGMVRFLFWC